MVNGRQYRLIQAILTEGNNRRACEVAGVSEPTFYRWLRQRPFRDALERIRREHETELARGLAHRQALALAEVPS
jgi:hypothetical protein